MVNREAQTTITGGRSVREFNRELRNTHREWKRRDEEQRRRAVADYLMLLDEANSSVSLATVFEVVHPVSSIGRILSLRKDKMIPAETSHISGKSTLGGWVNFPKITGQYLFVEEIEGYGLASGSGKTGLSADKAILQDGSIGSILMPCSDGSQNYTFGHTSIHMKDWSNSFERRNCQAVWGPSIVMPNELGVYQAREAAQHLGTLIAGSQVE